MIHAVYWFAHWNDLLCAQTTSGKGRRIVCSTTLCISSIFGIRDKLVTKIFECIMKAYIHEEISFFYWRTHVTACS